MAEHVTILVGELPRDLCPDCAERLGAMQTMATAREVTVPLAFPITAHGAEVHELTMRRLTAKDLRATSGVRDQESRGLALIGRLCGIPDSSVDQLTDVDLEALGEVLGNFGQRGPRNGGTR